MAISSECPSCGRRLTINASLLGKKVRCKGCGDTFVARDASDEDEASSRLTAERPRPSSKAVPTQKSNRPSFEDDEEVEAPARPSRSRKYDDDEDDYDRRDRRPSREAPGSSNKGLIIGLSVGGALLLGGVITTIILLMGDKKEEPATANATTPGAVPDLPLGGQNPFPALPQGLPDLPNPGQLPGIPNPPPDFPRIDNPIPQPPPEEPDPIKRAVNHLNTTDIFKQADAARSLAKTEVVAEHQAAVVKALKSVIENRRPLVPRREAVTALVVWGPATDGAYFIELLDDQDGGVKEEAIRAVGKRKEVKAATTLVGMLSDFFKRDVAAQALKEMGPGAEPAVLKQLTSSRDNGVRIECLKILKKIGTAASQPTLADLVDDSDQGVARAAEDALGDKLSTVVDAAKRPIKRALKDLDTNDIFRQGDAARKLAKMEVVADYQAAVVKALKAIIENRRPLIPRREAVTALAIWGPATDSAYLIDLLDDQDGGVKEEAIRALGKRKELKAADAVARRLTDFFQRGVAAQALKDMGSGAENAVLKQLTSSTDNGVRIECLKILKKIGTAASQPTLTALTQDRDRGVAKAALDALGKEVAGNGEGTDKPPVNLNAPFITIRIVLKNVNQWKEVEAKLKALADGPGADCTVVAQNGTRLLVRLSPVNSDPKTFSKKITFARVTSVQADKRLIYLNATQ